MEPTRLAQDEYHYQDSKLNQSHSYLLPIVLKLLADRAQGKPLRVIDLGCGNGAIATAIAGLGHEVVGVDASESGISYAQAHGSSAVFHLGSVYDDLSSRLGKFDVVVSLEVIEHVMEPRRFVATLSDLLAPDAVAIVSTPYHGYIKNLTIALLDRFDSHVDPLWDHGHIKFWSRRTITALFAEQNLRLRRMHRVGRLPPIAKSMVGVFEK